jgi:tRNA (adenine22-N1)-methyltransferase
MVLPGYDHIWDCCCDHGLLGSALLAQPAAPTIHFVDIVPELTSTLKNKLHHFHSNSPSRWRVHCMNLERLSIKGYEGKNLIIIAGVGGDLITQFVTSIHKAHSATNIDFLLCPVHHQFTLRRKLIELDFSLKNEVLLEENKRFYEILLVSSSAITNDKQRKISPVGELIWQVNTAEQFNTATHYLKKKLNHFQKIHQKNNNDVQHIIDAYRSINI